MTLVDTVFDSAICRTKGFEILFIVNKPGGPKQDQILLDIPSRYGMSVSIIGYSAASISVIAFGAQFVHTLRCESVEGISVGRTLFDAMSLVLWVAYATRVEDIPLLIATGCELMLSLCVCAIILRYHFQKIGCWTLYILNTDSKNEEGIVVIVSALRTHKRPPPLDSTETPLDSNREYTGSPVT